jgi:hypothetical protein
MLSNILHICSFVSATLRPNESAMVEISIFSINRPF